MDKPIWRRLAMSRSTWGTSATKVRLFAVLGAISIVSVTLWRIDAARETTLRTHRVVTENLARSLSDNAAAKFLGADLLAGGLADGVRRERNSESGLTRLQQRLGRRVQSVSGVRALAAYDADGSVLAAAVSPSVLGDVAADRDVLAFHSSNTGLEAHFGRPLQDPVTGLWSISLSHRIERPDGSFGGMAVATLELAEFYSRFDLGSHGSISLVLQDGTMIVRAPFLAGRVGANIADGPFFRAYLDRPTTGSAKAVSAFDGRLREESYSRVAGFPLVVFVASTHDDILAAWKKAAATELIIASSSAALLCLLGWRLANQMRVSDMAEQAVRRNEERFRSLYTKTPLPLHSLSGDGRIEHVSQAWLEMMGYDREGVLGRPLTDFMAEPSACRAAESDWPLLLRTGGLTDAEYRVVTKSGEFLDVIASAQVERDADGNFLRVLGGLTNVTERRRAEEALRQAQKIEAVGQLTGGVAHDFNNLLAVVMGNLELLRKRLPDDLKAIRLLDNAMKGAERGAGLTQRMLAFARKQDLRPEAVDVGNLVRGMADLLQRSLGPEVRIATRFPAQLARANVDANQLELAVLNLAVNARDAMPRGGTLAISASEQTVPSGRAAHSIPGRYVCLSVSDTGEGMDDKTLSRATEPFFTTKGVGKGTGLGLSMTHGLAAQSGGRLVLRSEVGRGTTAELWFPVCEEPQPDRAAIPAIAGPVASAARSLAPLTILVVDDDQLVLANTVAMLEDLGHAVSQATSGQDALARLNACDSLDLLVTDQAMPGMTGVQLGRAVIQARPGLPVLLVSGYADLPPEAAGFHRLDKPFSQSALAAAVSALVGVPATTAEHDASRSRRSGRSEDVARHVAELNQPAARTRAAPLEVLYD